jgi:archaellum biogenesis ATPase FlaH
MLRKAGKRVIHYTTVRRSILKRFANQVADHVAVLENETKQEREEREEKHDKVNTRNALLGGMFAVVGTVLGTYIYAKDPSKIQHDKDLAELHLRVHERFTEEKRYVQPQHYFRNTEMVDTMITKLREVIRGFSNNMILIVGERGIGKSTSMRTSLYEINETEKHDQQELSHFLWIDLSSAGLYGVACHIMPTSLLLSATDETLKSLHHKIEQALRQYSDYRKLIGLKKNAVIVVDSCNSTEVADVLELREIGKKLCDENLHVRFVFLSGEDVADDLLRDARSLHITSVKEASTTASQQYLQIIKCPDPDLIEKHTGGIILYMHEVKRILDIQPAISSHELLQKLEQFLSIQHRDINQMVDVSMAIREVCSIMVSNGAIRYGDFVRILKREYTDQEIQKLLNTGDLWMTSADGLFVEFHSRAKKAHIERLLPRL